MKMKPYPDSARSPPIKFSDQNKKMNISPSEHFHWSFHKSAHGRTLDSFAVSTLTFLFCLSIHTQQIYTPVWYTTLNTSLGLLLLANRSDPALTGVHVSYSNITRGTIHSQRLKCATHMVHLFGTPPFLVSAYQHTTIPDPNPLASRACIRVAVWSSNTELFSSLTAYFTYHLRHIDETHSSGPWSITKTYSSIAIPPWNPGPPINRHIDKRICSIKSLQNFNLITGQKKPNRRQLRTFNDVSCMYSPLESPIQSSPYSLRLVINSKLAFPILSSAS